MTSLSKNVYINKLDDIVKYQSKYNEKHNNKYHSAIKMKPIDVKSTTYIDSSNDINDKNPKFKIGDNVNICLNRFLRLKKLKMLCRGKILLMILIRKKLLELFMKTNCKKKNQKEFRIEKVITRKGDKLYVKWKCYDNSAG